MVQYFRELIAWQKAMTLVKHVYEVTKQFPDGENSALYRKCEDVRCRFRATLTKGKLEIQPENSSSLSELPEVQSQN